VKHLPDLFLAVFFVLLGVGAVSAVRATGEVDYCYIEAAWHAEGQQAAIALYAHAPWRADRRIGFFKTHDEVIEMAKKLKCPLEHR